MIRPAYSRTFLERLGQSNHRSEDYSWDSALAEGERVAKLVSQTQIQGDLDPSCVIFVSKRKGWGTTGNHESMPMTIHGARHLKRNFNPNLYHRYVVNVYLKKTGASQARRETRGW